MTWCNIIIGNFATLSCNHFSRKFTSADLETTIQNQTIEPQMGWLLIDILEKQIGRAKGVENYSNK